MQVLCNPLRAIHAFVANSPHNNIDLIKRSILGPCDTCGSETPELVTEDTAFTAGTLTMVTTLPIKSKKGAGSRSDGVFLFLCFFCSFCFCGEPVFIVPRRVFCNAMFFF